MNEVISFYKWICLTDVTRKKVKETFFKKLEKSFRLMFFKTLNNNIKMRNPTQNLPNCSLQIQIQIQILCISNFVFCICNFSV